HGVGICAASNAIVEDAEAAANRSFAGPEWIVGEAEPRREEGALVIDQSTRIARRFGGDDHAVRGIACTRRDEADQHRRVCLVGHWIDTYLGSVYQCWIDEPYLLAGIVQAGDEGGRCAIPVRKRSP